MDNQQIIDILKLAWPLILLQIFFQIYALVDLIRKKKTRNLSPAIWAIIIIIGEILGPILYLLLGRSEE